MSRWETTSELVVPGVTAEDVWARAYADARAWPRWNDALASAELDGPLAVGAIARVRFRTGLRLRFRITEADAPHVFTDEGRLPGARMAHRHALEPDAVGARLTNTISIDGPLAPLWARVLGPQAERGLPGWQGKIAEMVVDEPSRFSA